LAILRTSKPVDFAARDGRAVDLFVAVGGPESARRDYLAVLGTLSYLFRSDQVKEELRKAPSGADAADLVRRLSADAARPA
jgi:mannitol/fructose-specific phosphotransferase system IIA component (Ntr-type)